MNRVAELRTACKLSRTQLAAAVGVSERYIYFIEKGARSPSMKTAQLIASVLKTPTDDIFLSQSSTDSTVADSA